MCDGCHLFWLQAVCKIIAFAERFLIPSRTFMDCGVFEMCGFMASETHCETQHWRVLRATCNGGVSATWESLHGKLRDVTMVKRTLVIRIYPSWNASCGLRGPSWTAVFLDAMFTLPVSLPGTFLEPSWTFMDCGVSDKCFVFRVYLPVSLPGTFADLHGLRHFWKVRVLWCYDDVKTKPRNNANTIQFSF